MLVEHVVLLKTTRAYTSDEKQEIASRLLTIPGVISISMGQNYTKRALEYSTGFIVRFESMEAEIAYREHPVHVHVRDTLLKPTIAKGAETTPPILAMDYECYSKHNTGWTDHLGGPAIGFACGVVVCTVAGILRR